MAYERLSNQKVIGQNLGALVDSSLLLLKKFASQRNLEDESKFNKAVLEGNLTLDQQIAYRTQQLNRVTAGDRDEKRRIRDEISALKDQKEQKEYADEYLSQLSSVNDGVQSIDSTIKWLEDRMARTTDQAILKNIRENISDLKKMRYDNEKTALSNATTFALNDKRETTISNQIDRVNEARSKALLAGNDDYVSMLDLQLQALDKSLSETKINVALVNMSTATLTGQSSLGLLNEINKQIERADSKTPITIGDQTFESAKNFWETQRGEYLNDRTDNGFFGRYKNELSEKVTYKQNAGVFDNAALKDVQGWYDFIKDRPEMSDYADRIEKEQQAALKASADIRATSIYNTYLTDLDAKKAVSSLAQIQDGYGIDQSTNYQKIQLAASQTKEQQVSDILATMKSLMSQNPGMTNQQAMDQAIKSGAGATFSPVDLTTMKASDIINQAGDKATKQAFGQDDKTTVDPAAEGSSFIRSQLSDGGLYKLPNQNAVYKYENGQLRKFVGNWSSQEFKQQTGKDFSAVQTLPSIASLSIGADIIKPVSIPAQTTQQPVNSTFIEGGLYKKRGISTVYKLENNKLRPFTGAWDEQKFTQVTGKRFSDVKEVDDIGSMQYGSNIYYNQ